MQVVGVRRRTRAGVSFFCGFTFAALALLVWQGQSHADTVTLTLDGASPAGTVTLAGSQLPAGYNPVNVYAGVLDWTTGTVAGVPNEWTYCVDVAAIINVNHSYQYSYTPQVLNFSPTTINALQWLWQDSTFANAGQINSQPNVDAISAEHAAMFQVAIWDILYDEGTTPTLSFSNPGSGLTGTDLTNALAAAHADYLKGVGGGPTTGTSELTELIASSGQNQVTFIGMAPAPTLPMPRSFAGGLALLGLLGVGCLRRKANA